MGRNKRLSTDYADLRRLIFMLEIKKRLKKRLSTDYTDLYTFKFK